MKKIFLLITVLAVMVSCKFERNELGYAKNFEVVVIDSCEYQFKSLNRRGFLAHKGNCRFCKERRQKEMEELLKKLKE